MLGLTSPDSLLPLPPTVQQIALFEERKSKGPSVKDFKLDLQGTSIKSPWNKKAARVFAKDFLAGQSYGKHPKNDIRDTFFVHLVTLREHFKKQIGLVQPGDESLKKAAAAKASRMKTVCCAYPYQSCMLKSFLQLNSQRVAACREKDELELFMPLIEKLAQEDGFSDDECDHHRRNIHRGDNRQYIRIRPIWRAPEISDWLAVIDRVYISLRFNPDGSATRGNWVRLRLESTGLVDKNAQPVIGLPENFYDPIWLQKLTPKQQRKLKMKAIVDLKHNDDILEYVSHFQVDLCCSFYHPGFLVDSSRSSAAMTSPYPLNADTV